VGVRKVISVQVGPLFARLASASPLLLALKDVHKGCSHRKRNGMGDSEVALQLTVLLEEAVVSPTVVLE
jgi:hypothetical protein